MAPNTNKTNFGWKVGGVAVEGSGMESLGREVSVGQKRPRRLERDLACTEKVLDDFLVGVCDHPATVVQPSKPVENRMFSRVMAYEQ